MDTSERLINNIWVTGRDKASEVTIPGTQPTQSTHPSGMLAPESAWKFTHTDLQQTDNQLFVQQKKGLFGINIESCTQVSTEQEENSFTEGERKLERL